MNAPRAITDSSHLGAGTGNLRRNARSSASIPAVASAVQDSQLAKALRGSPEVAQQPTA